MTADLWGVGVPAPTGPVVTDVEWTPTRRRDLLCADCLAYQHHRYRQGLPVGYRRPVDVFMTTPRERLALCGMHARERGWPG